MGNPSILGPKPGDLQPPDGRRLTWDVYRLRERGIKLDLEGIMRTRVEGELTVITRGASRAQVIDGHGNQLATMEVVKPPKTLSRGGGMLLLGREQLQTRRAVEEHPQAWWCVLKLDR